MLLTYSRSSRAVDEEEAAWNSTTLATEINGKHSVCLLSAGSLCFWMNGHEGVFAARVAAALPLCVLSISRVLHASLVRVRVVSQ